MTEAPKPITLTQVDAADYVGLEPKPYVIVGDIPGSGGVGGVTSAFVSAATRTKTQVVALAAIADTSTATATDVAVAVNAIIAALKA